MTSASRLIRDDKGVCRLHDHPVAHRSPWPTSVGRLIRDYKGVRPLEVDEFALGLGIPSYWGGLEKIAIFRNGLDVAFVKTKTRHLRLRPYHRTPVDGTKPLPLRSSLQKREPGRRTTGSNLVILWLTCSAPCILIDDGPTATLLSSSS
jgi:hypothetical protein